MSDSVPNTNTKVNTLPSHSTLDNMITGILGLFGSAKVNYSNLEAPQTPPEVSQGNIAEQNFNPGNLIFAGQPGAVKGAPKGDGTYWAKFENEAAGYQALQNDIGAKLKRQPNMTVAHLLDLRSPSSENDTSSLHYNVMDSLKDLKDSGKIKTLMANQLPVSAVPMDRLAQAIAQAEGYKQSKLLKE